MSALMHSDESPVSRVVIEDCNITTREDRVVFRQSGGTFYIQSLFITDLWVNEHPVRWALGQVWVRWTWPVRKWFR